MSYTDLDYRPHFHNLVKRSQNPVYKCANVLTTDVLPIAEYERFTDLMRSSAIDYPDSWYLHTTLKGEPQDITRVLPTIIQSFNRSRPLRRARISGLRMCNYIAHINRPYYVTDMLITSTYGALLFVAALCEYANSFPDAVVTLKPGCDKPIKSTARYVHKSAIDRFWRRAKLPQHYCTIIPNFDDPLRMGYVSWNVTSKDIIGSLWAILENLRLDVESVKIGQIEISRNPLHDPEEYTVREFDKVRVPLRYRRFSAFGTFHNNSKYLLY